jgi:hypothetical protein
MPKKRLVAGTAITLIIAGCSSSSGILPAGPDTYTVTERLSPFYGGGSEAERLALSEANIFCEDHGRKFLPVSRDDSGDHMQWGSTGYSVTFHCYLPSDPRYVHAQYGPGTGVSDPSKKP